MEGRGTLLDERFDLRGRPRADCAPRLASVREHGHHRNRSNLKPLAQLRERVGVDLHDHDPAGEAGGHLLELRRHHPAGTTPRRPEVDNDRQRRQGDQAIEFVRAPDVDREGRDREVTLALAAARRFAQPLVGQPVFLPAGRTGYDDAAWIEVGVCHHLSRVLATTMKRPDYEAIFDAALDAIIAIDHEGRVVAVNAAAERLFGIPRDTACGALLADLIIPPRFRQAHLDGLRRYLGTGRSHVIGRRVQFAALRADGSEFPIELAIARLAALEPPIFAGFIRDLTEQREIEADYAGLLVRAQEARLEAERANAAKDEFLAIVSHELRTPINSMLGWTSLLKGGSLTDEKRARAIDAIERGASAQVQLVEDLVDVARIVRGTLRLQRARIDAARTTRASVDLVQPLAQERGVAIAIAGADEPVMIRADRVRLQQIVWNLVSNAVKFTPRGGTVSVEVARRGDDVSIVVEDTGIGIRPEFLPHLFDRFRQDASEARTHGLGLGLAIVRQLVQLHGGSVAAHSDGEGKGSRFTVVLPIGAKEQS